MQTSSVRPTTSSSPTQKAGVFIGVDMESRAAEGFDGRVQGSIQARVHLVWSPLQIIAGGGYEIGYVQKVCTLTVYALKVSGRLRAFGNVITGPSWSIKPSGKGATFVLGVSVTSYGNLKTSLTVFKISQNGEWSWLGQETGAH